VSRVYLDYNATTPIRAEVLEGMIEVANEFGNPSSVHAEGRRARGIVERARLQISEAMGASSARVIFTSSATEACAMALRGRKLHGCNIEHDAVVSWIENCLRINGDGSVLVPTPKNSVLQFANSETGILQKLPKGLAVSDLSQAFGKVPVAFDWMEIDVGIISAHKIGGPKGLGAIIIRDGVDLEPLLLGGGQEQGARAGTENVMGIVGFGIAARAAAKSVADGEWDRISEMRDFMESSIADSVSGDIVFVGKGSNRLPNTSCVALEGWKSEIQVMNMDLKGFAISAGSACSSGKVRSSRVLQAMGYKDEISKSAIRVSLGLETLKEDIIGFVSAWLSAKNFFETRVV
jgi:cysteine desulfurase